MKSILNRNFRIQRYVHTNTQDIIKQRQSTYNTTTLLALAG